MPIDPVKMRKITDQNDQITEGVKAMSKRLQKLDPTNCEETSTTAKAWAENVHQLKVNLEEQKALSKAMRYTQLEDEQQGDSFRDRYRFLVDRLKDDIRFFYHQLREFVDLPHDFANQRTWDHCLYDMEMDMKQLSAAHVGENSLVNADPIVMMLNYRDKVISCLLAAVLFQKAVLDWDLKSERSYADGPMVEMAEMVVNIFSRTESLPAKYRTYDLPAAAEKGPFTYHPKQESERGQEATISALSPLQGRLLAVLREMQSLSKGLRHMTFGTQVFISDQFKASAASSKQGASEELRKEMVRWFDKCISLEKELNMIKTHRGSSSNEVRVEQLTAKCQEKEQQSKQHITRIQVLESDVQSLKIELSNLRREKNDLAEKNRKMEKENLPVLERMNNLLGKSREAVDRLAADADMLANMFRLQVQEKKKIIAEKSDISKELVKVERQLESARLKNQSEEADLQKKETLYLRTMAARKSIHECVLEQKERIREVEEKMVQREDDVQVLLKVKEGRDSESKQLKEDLNRARRRIEELKLQKTMCCEEFERVSRKPASVLLQGFRPSPTLPTSELDNAGSER